MERILDNMWTFIITLHFLNRCLLGASTVRDLGIIHTIVPHITKREMAVLSNSNLSKRIQTCAFQRERTCSRPCWGSGSGQQTAIPVPPRPGPPRHGQPSAYLLWHPLSLETPSVTSQKKTACQFMDSFSFFFWLIYVASGILVLRPGTEPGPWQWQHGWRPNHWTAQEFPSRTLLKGTVVLEKLRMKGKKKSLQRAPPTPAFLWHLGPPSFQLTNALGWNGPTVKQWYHVRTQDGQCQVPGPENHSKYTGQLSKVDCRSGFYSPLWDPCHLLQAELQQKRGWNPGSVLHGKLPLEVKGGGPAQAWNWSQ